MKNNNKKKNDQQVQGIRKGDGESANSINDHGI